MLLPEETLNRTIRHAINMIVDTPEYAMRAQQNDAIAPNFPYASVQHFSESTSGVPYVQHAMTTVSRLDASVIANQLVIYQLQFHKAGAFDNARLVHASLVRPDVQALFSSVGLAMLYPSPVINISEPIEPSWEERATFDIEFNYVQKISLTGNEPDGANTIDSYTMNATFDDTTTEISCGD